MTHKDLAVVIPQTPQIIAFQILCKVVDRFMFAGRAGDVEAMQKVQRIRIYVTGGRIA